MALCKFHTITTPAQDSQVDHVRAVKGKSVKVMRGQSVRSDFDLYFNPETIVISKIDILRGVHIFT